MDDSSSDGRTGPTSTPDPRRYVDASGQPVNEAGDVLTGVPPWDSEAFAEFCGRERRILDDPDTTAAGSPLGDAERVALLELIGAMTDAGEVEEARARLEQLDSVLTAAPAYSPAFVEASRLRREALMLPGSREDRLATTGAALARVQDLAGAVTADETAAVRRMIGELGLEVDALRSGPRDGRA